MKEWMSLCVAQYTQSEYFEGEHENPMLESCLTFLATLINVRTNLGKSINPFWREILSFSESIVLPSTLS